MKLSLLFAAATLAAVSFPGLAHADEGPVVGARFESSATHQAVQAAACSFDASSNIDGRNVVFDVHVSGDRCPNRAVPAGAIPLFVRFEYGDKERVVVAAVVPEGVDAHKLRAAVLDIGNELERRIDRLSSPPKPPPVVYTSTAQSSVAPSPNYSWARESYAERDWSKPYKRANPGLMAGGILLVIAGTFATIGGAVMAGSIGNTTPGLLIFGAGLASLGGGIPMVVIGGKKVPNMTASVSPTGGNLRVTF